MIGFPLIKRRATAAVARFREKLSATKERCGATKTTDGRPLDQPCLRFYAHPASRISGDDTSETMARAPFLLARDVSSLVLDKKRVIVEITGA